MSFFLRGETHWSICGKAAKPRERPEVKGRWSSPSGTRRSSARLQARPWRVSRAHAPRGDHRSDGEASGARSGSARAVVSMLKWPKEPCAMMPAMSITKSAAARRHGASLGSGSSSSHGATISVTNMPLSRRRKATVGRWTCASQPRREGIGWRIMKSRTYSASLALVPRNLSLPKPIISRKSSQRTRKAAAGCTASPSDSAAASGVVSAPLALSSGAGAGSSSASQPASRSRQSHGMDRPKMGSNER
mmetsp:Transcript_7882/g.25988  ORF Transcript_7882/g.25988 Transcript_7882/m.25988 type:complete len:248 (+) Transcript_7882:626-1369(+)